MSDYLGGAYSTAKEALSTGAATDAVERTASVPGITRLEATRYTITHVPSGANGYQWGVLSVLDVKADAGDHCASYNKAHKFGAAPIWSGVDETYDHFLGVGGNVYGREISVNGVRGKVTQGSVLLLVAGRSPESVPGDSTGLSVIDHVIRIVPYVPDWGYVRANYGIRIELPCRDAISLQGGDHIRFSDDPAVPVLKFDPQTGIVGFWKGRLCVQGVHAVSGQAYSMQTF